MQNHTSIILRSTLFKGIPESELPELLEYLGAYTKKYNKGEYIYHAGENITRCGIILSGKLQAQNISYDGNVNVSAVHDTSDVFGDILMSSEAAQSPVDVVALSDAYILFIPFARIMLDCGIGGIYRLRMNLLGEISEKYFSLRKKITYLSAQTLREKIILFLLDKQEHAGKSEFTVNVTREQMAGIIGSNRSALSRELSRMRDEGLIDFDKNRFTILSLEDIR
ncbi:MAG: Crp/Fnr family transcriptional regulator [Eubacteriaceae bacterium]|nr:Crp/Fnr family transcriptional regulator [Eubacteriaceae bacterium]